MRFRLSPFITILLSIFMVNLVFMPMNLEAARAKKKGRTKHAKVVARAVNPVRSGKAAETPEVAPLAPDGSVNVRAKAALVLNLQTGEVLYQKNPLARLPIASVTKLMTVLTLLNMNPDLNKVMTVTKQDVTHANWTQLRAGEIIPVHDLLYSTLVMSDNAAARTVARASGLAMDEFVERMNQTAVSLGLLNSQFADPTGLNPANMSTVVDVAALLWTAFQHDVIARIVRTPDYQFASNRGLHEIRTTNRLLRETNTWEILGGKTGHISQAGFCLVTRARNRLGEDLVGVVLGGVSSNERFADMRRLLMWGFQNVEQQQKHAGG